MSMSRNLILPGTGRGTTRRVVEGHGRSVPILEVFPIRTCPSTMLRPSTTPAASLRTGMVPLPLQGRMAL
jgi:hypothetical protein